MKQREGEEMDSGVLLLFGEGGIPETFSKTLCILPLEWTGDGTVRRDRRKGSDTHTCFPTKPSHLPIVCLFCFCLAPTSFSACTYVYT